MHYRRSHPRERGKRGKSSSWSYPKTEHGDAAQSRYGAALRTAVANDSLRWWESDPDGHEARDFSAYSEEFADPLWETWYEALAQREW